MGYTASSSKTITTSMIGNQPLANIQAVTIKSLAINYTAVNSVPFYFKVYFNGSDVVMTKTGEIAMLEFDVCILTLNSSAISNSSLGMVWGTTFYSITYATYGALRQDPLTDALSSMYYITGLVAAEWKTRNHISFRFEQRVSTMNLSFLWRSNSSYNSYSFFCMYFTIENCTNPSYPYMVYQLQRCYTTCPSGFFGDNSVMRCLSCSISNCTKCSASNVCSVCNSSFNFIIVGGQCV